MARKPRIQKGRDQRKTFFVFCEGKSEKVYVEFLRQTLRPSVQLVPIIGKSNISEAEINTHLDRRGAVATDRVFLMYDLDVPGMLERLLAIGNATLLLSNPCLELWYLLHFTDHKKQIDSDECIKRLSQHVAGYKKGVIQPELYSALQKEILTANQRASCLRSPSNPSTTIWRLIELLK